MAWGTGGTVDKSVPPISPSTPTLHIGSAGGYARNTRFKAREKSATPINTYMMSWD
jgi:hypothetical protein